MFTKPSTGSASSMAEQPRQAFTAQPREEGTIRYTYSIVQPPSVPTVRSGNSAETAFGADDAEALGSSIVRVSSITTCRLHHAFDWAC